jgi:hypothetical protein
MADVTPRAKQQLLVEFLLSSSDIYLVCKSIIHASYFHPDLKPSIEFIHSYYDNYNTLPSTLVIQSETNQQFRNLKPTKDEVSYCIDEVESFCKQQALEHAVIKASTLLGTSKSNQIESIIKAAASVSINRDTGSDYFARVQERLTYMAAKPQRQSTGWSDLDEALGGGDAESELILFSANSGGGKSITLGNYALNKVELGCNVLYLTLELSTDLVEQRFDTMITGISTVNWEPHANAIYKGVTEYSSGKGRLIVEKMPTGTTANQIRGLLKEFELQRGYTPDVLVVDYLDLMGANSGVTNSPFEKDKEATEQLRDILGDYKMRGATASQQNRDAVNAPELNHSHIAGGISKVNTTDWWFSIILTPQMKARGEIAFKCLKSRSSDAVGRQFLLMWDNNRLRILDRDKGGDRNSEVLNTLSTRQSRKNEVESDVMSVFDL